MLWYKSWLDTRWRFLIGFALLSVMACGVLLNYSISAPLLPALSERPLDTTTATGRLLSEAVQLSQTYRGFVWFQWFRQNLLQIGTLFAVILGSGGVFSESHGGLFTLSLPASRNQWLAVRAATGLSEFFVLATVPSLAIAVLSPLIGQHYSAVDVVAHGICIFVAATVFYCLAFLLSTIFSDIWRPVLIAIGIACVTGLVEARLGLDGLFRVMSGHRYFESGSLPWLGLLSSSVLSMALLYGASLNVARKDL